MKKQKVLNKSNWTVRDVQSRRIFFPELKKENICYIRDPNPFTGGLTEPAFDPLLILETINGECQQPKVQETNKMPNKRKKQEVGKK